MTPKNNVKLNDYDGTLLCPNCGEYVLHHEQVDVWNRNEDDTKGTHAVVTPRTRHSNSDMSGNPSPRRHGLSIQFFCEFCSADGHGNLTDRRFTLDILQHKGSTYLQWRDYE